MQTCSRCNAQAQDYESECPRCHASLAEFSATAVALRRLQTNSRVANVRVVAEADACPACQQVAGTYAKDQAPHLPVPGCSCSNGCCCFYEPMLTEIYP